jgi:hypothetical protein
MFGMKIASNEKLMFKFIAIKKLRIKDYYYYFTIKIICLMDRPLAKEK